MEALSSIDNRQEIIQYMKTTFKPTDRIYINIMDNLAHCTDHSRINADHSRINADRFRINADRFHISMEKIQIT